MTNGLVTHGWLWDVLSCSNVPVVGSGRVGGRVWVLVRSCPEISGPQLPHLGAPFPQNRTLASTVPGSWP